MENNIIRFLSFPYGLRARFWWSIDI